MGTSNAFSSTPIVTYPVVGNDISSSAGIPSSAMQHAYLAESNFGLALSGTPVNREEIVHVANGAETVLGFHVGMKDTGSAASSTFDLIKYNAGTPGGVSILSSVVTVANTDPDLVKKNGTIASPTLADGDVLTVKIIVSTPTGATGPYAQVALNTAAGNPT